MDEKMRMMTTRTTMVAFHEPFISKLNKISRFCRALSLPFLGLKESISKLKSRYKPSSERIKFILRKSSFYPHQTMHISK